MEPDNPDLEVGRQALVILCLIPIVLFALWADYEIEIEKIKLVSLCVMLFQLTLFLGSSEVREAFPLSTDLTFSACVLLQMWLQSRTEKRISSPDKPIVSQQGEVLKSGDSTDSGEESDGPEKNLNVWIKLSLNSLLSWTTGAAIYLFTLLFCIQSAVWLGTTFHVSKPGETLLLILGGTLGVIFGLGLSFAMSAFHLRKMLPNRPMPKGDLLSKLETLFLGAGLNPPEFYIVDLLGPISLVTVTIAGLNQGRGIFKQSIFISASAIKTLTFEQLTSLVNQKIGQICLKQLQRRFGFSLILITVTTLSSIFSVLLTSQFIPVESAFDLIGPAMALLFFFISFSLLNHQTKKHELEADVYSIVHLKTPVADFIDAIRKTEPAYPETERRIVQLMEFLKKNYPHVVDTQPKDAENDSAKAS